MVAFTLPLFVFLFLLFDFDYGQKQGYIIVLIIFSLFIVGSSLWLFLGTNYYDYSFFSSNLIAALLATFIVLILGYWIYRVALRSVNLLHSAKCQILLF